jgi:hypothetical protein
VWGTIFGAIIVFLAVIGVWRFVALVMSGRRPDEPGDDAEVLARVKRGPKRGSGAVALNEPDDHDKPGE